MSFAKSGFCHLACQAESAAAGEDCIPEGFRDSYFSLEGTPLIMRFFRQKPDMVGRLPL